MLVLSRKEGEEIVIPSLGITIMLVELGTHKARIGIEAPPHIRVWRRELMPSVEAAEQEAKERS
jgi:carbon storage regulator